MYEVVLINDKKETIINAVSTEKEAPKITGTIKKGINVIDKFTFIILPNNPGFNLIEPYKTRIRVINSKNQKIEFYLLLYFLPLNLHLLISFDHQLDIDLLL